MKAIQILHYSLFGYILSLYLKYYFFKKTFKNTKILQGHKINYKYKSSTYQKLSKTIYQKPMKSTFLGFFVFLMWFCLIRSN